MGPARRSTFTFLFVARCVLIADATRALHPAPLLAGDMSRQFCRSGNSIVTVCTVHNRFRFLSYIWGVVRRLFSPRQNLRNLAAVCCDTCDRSQMRSFQLSRIRESHSQSNWPCFIALASDV